MDRDHAPAPATPSTSDPNRDRALDLFEQSMRSYREGRFQEAVDKLIEARKLKSEPVLLYNLARAYEALGQSKEAAEAYAQYLNEEPNAPDRKAIEGRITTLRAQAAQAAELAARQSSPPSGEESKERDTKDKDVVVEPRESAASSVVPWVVVGAGALTIGAGFVIYGLAQGKHDDATQDPVQLSAAGKQDSAEGLATAATATILAGAVVTVIGAAWVVVRMTSSSTTRASSRFDPPLRWTF